jgi:hypothetical protein
MTDWTALAQARALDIPAEAVERVAPSLSALEQSFEPLKARLPFTLEPAIVLSESAVIPE